MVDEQRMAGNGNGKKYDAQARRGLRAKLARSGRACPATLQE